MAILTLQLIKLHFDLLIVPYMSPAYPSVKPVDVFVDINVVFMSMCFFFLSFCHWSVPFAPAGFREMH